MVRGQTSSKGSQASTCGDSKDCCRWPPCLRPGRLPAFERRATLPPPRGRGASRLAHGSHYAARGARGRCEERPICAYRRRSPVLSTHQSETPIGNPMHDSPGAGTRTTGGLEPLACAGQSVFCPLGDAEGFQRRGEEIKAPLRRLLAQCIDEHRWRPRARRASTSTPQQRPVALGRSP